jgi:hypothetical protein
VYFAIFIPSPIDPNIGNLINVVGAPMTGYKHVFEHGYRLSLETQSYELVPLGHVDRVHIANLPADADAVRSTGDEPCGDIEVAAVEVPAPGVSEVFMAPVNDVCSHPFFPVPFVCECLKRALTVLAKDNEQKAPGVDDGVYPTSCG